MKRCLSPWSEAVGVASGKTSHAWIWLKSAVTDPLRSKRTHDALTERPDRRHRRDAWSKIASVVRSITSWHPLRPGERDLLSHHTTGRAAHRQIMSHGLDMGVTADAVPPGAPLLHRASHSSRKVAR